MGSPNHHRFVRHSTAVEIKTIGSRKWRATKAETGWRLEFKDPEDRAWTNAGLFESVELATREARRG